MKISSLSILFMVMFSLVLFPHVFADGNKDVKIDEITEKIQTLQNDLKELRVELAHTELESEKANGLREQIEYKQQAHDNLLEKLRELMPIEDYGELQVTEKFGQTKQLPTNYDNDFDIDDSMLGCDGTLQAVRIQGYADIVDNKISIQQYTSNPISIGLFGCWNIQYQTTTILVENFSQGWACTATFDVQPVSYYDAICPVTEGSITPKQINQGDLISMQFTLNYEGWWLGPYNTLFSSHV